MFGFSAVMVVAFFQREAIAATNQFGETGLLSIATAETVGNGNFCAGLWGNSMQPKSGATTTIIPFSLTYGMTKDLELNVSYPNVSLNDNVDTSDRGFMNIGFKGRFKGTNRSKYKLVFSATLLKPVSFNPAISNQKDYEGKIILGTRSKHLKLHLGGGYRLVDDPLRDDEKFINGAVDISYTRRARFFVEGEWRSGGSLVGDSYSRLTPGVQVFVTPYMTLSGGVDFSVSGDGPERRIIVGVSTCGGLGEYIIPIPKPPKAITAESEQLRGKPPVPVLPKMIIARREKIKTEELEAVKLRGDMALGQVALAPASKYEVPLTPGEELVLLPSMQMPSMGLDLPSTVAPAAPQPLSLTPPSEPGAKQAKKGRTAKKFRLPDLMFDTNNWVFNPESMEIIEELTAELLSVEGPFYIKIEGHTDSIGSDTYNEKLSLQRATAVAVTMMEFGVPAERVFIEGHGESRPIASNETVGGRSLNRRVDILLIVPE